MPSGSEKDVLRIIAQEGGETTLGRIRYIMSCYSSDYVRSIVGSLGRKDYLDWLADGRVILANKGRRALGIAVDEWHRVSTDSFEY
ncbi:MAG: hypothetical protein ACE5H6_04120 [Dehalococcoidia bacterium]